MDPRFVDVDFPSDPNYKFGAKPDKPAHGKFGAYGDNAPVIAESQWKDLAASIEKEGGIEWLVTRIFNQGPEGSCVSDATSQCNEVVQCKQFGPDKVVHLSAISLYKRIGSSPNSGSSCDDALDEMSKTGILPLNDTANVARFKHTMPNTGFYEKFPAGWESTAANFRSLEWFICESRAELISALFNGHPVVVGRAGHSICYTKPVYLDGSLYVAYVNSWGEWGDGLGRFSYGFGYDSERMISQSSDWAFALRSVTTPTA